MGGRGFEAIAAGRETAASCNELKIRRTSG